MKIKKFQSGGSMPEQAAPAPEQPDVMEQLIQAAAAALQNQDCQIALQVCDALLQLVQGAMGPGPVDQPANQEVIFKRGGKIARRRCKK